MPILFKTKRKLENKIQCIGSSSYKLNQLVDNLIQSTSWTNSIIGSQQMPHRSAVFGGSNSPLAFPGRSLVGAYGPALMLLLLLMMENGHRVGLCSGWQHDGRLLAAAHRNLVNLRLRSLSHLNLNLLNFGDRVVLLELCLLFGLLLLLLKVLSIFRRTERIFFRSFRQVGTRVLAQMVLAVERLAAFSANLGLLTGVYNEMEIQMFLPFESLHANRADEGSVGVMAKFVPLEMFLAFQSGAADVADESPLDFVTNQVLLQQLFLRVGHVTLRTAEKRGAIQRRDNAHLARFRLLWLRGLLLVLLLSFGFSVRVLAFGHVRDDFGLTSSHGDLHSLLARNHTP